MLRCRDYAGSRLIFAFRRPIHDPRGGCGIVPLQNPGEDQKMNLRHALCITAAALAMASPTTYAQDNTGGNDENSQATLEEIVVTARKREEKLRDLPLSVSAFTAADLEARQLDNIAQLSDATPNFTFESTTPISGSSASSSVYIRGVGQFDFTLVSEPGVGVYLDGVYVARSVGSVLDNIDVERIEVLRGPQGTLFGKNTIGGAINVTSKRPSKELEGYLELKTGTDDRFDAKGSFSGPITDKLGLRVTAARLTQDGYIENLGGGDNLSDTDATVGRLALEWTPNDAFMASLFFDGTRRRENGRAQKLLAFNPGAGVPAFGPFIGILAPILGVAYDERYLGGGKLTTFQGPNPTVRSDLDLWGTSLTLAYEVGNLTLKSITGYREFDTEFGRDSDNSPFNIVNTIDLMDHHQFSQELQLFGTALNDRLSWLTGLFYLTEGGSNRNDVLITPITIKSGGSIDNDGWAAFAQGTYKITEPLSLTLGGRYTDETKRFTPDQQVLFNEFTEPVFIPIFGGPANFFTDGQRILPVREFSRSDNDTSFSGSINYKWTANLMTYVSYAEGFKGGGFDQRVFPPRGPDGMPATFKPETLTQYELGWKWQNGADTVRLHGAVFFSQYDDMQVRVKDDLAPGVGNAGEGEVKGAELELTARPIRALKFEVGVGYLDTEITKLGLNIDPTADRISVGNRFINSPKWSCNVGAAYTANVSGSSELTTRLDWSWKSKVFNNWANDDLIAQDSFGLLNASAAWFMPDSGWDFVLAGKNLTDEEYIVTGNDELDSFGYAEAVYARPREWSFSVRKTF